MNQKGGALVSFSNPKGYYTALCKGMHITHGLQKRCDVDSKPYTRRRGMGMPKRRGDKHLLGSHCLNHYPRRLAARERSKVPLLTSNHPTFQQSKHCHDPSNFHNCLRRERTNHLASWAAQVTPSVAHGVRVRISASASEVKDGDGHGKPQ